jgi:hypothetical protein
MTGLRAFKVRDDFGTIDMTDPKKIVFRQGDTDADKARVLELLEDFTSTLQFLADWMFRTKALC